MPDTTRRDVLEALRTLPARIYKAECRLFEQSAVRLGRKADLDREEAQLTLDPELVNGKNAEIRAAQIHMATELARRSVEAVRSEEEFRAICLRQVQDEFRAARAMALLLGPAPTPEAEASDA